MIDFFQGHQLFLHPVIIDKSPISEGYQGAYEQNKDDEISAYLHPAEHPSANIVT